MIGTVKWVAVLTVGLLVAGTALVRAGDDKVLSPAGFLAKVIDTNASEKDLAEKAIKNAQSEDVRKYAQRLFDDHKKMLGNSMEVAKEMKIGVVTGLSKEHKEILAKLLTSSGKDFDRQFVQHMVHCHTNAVKMLEVNAKGNENAQLRDLATKSLPTIREHLATARKLNEQLNK